MILSALIAYAAIIIPLAFLLRARFRKFHRDCEEVWGGVDHDPSLGPDICRSATRR